MSLRQMTEMDTRREYAKVARDERKDFLHTPEMKKLIESWSSCRIWFKNHTDVDLTVFMSMTGDIHSPGDHVWDTTVGPGEVSCVYVGSCKGVYAYCAKQNVYKLWIPFKTVCFFENI